MRSGKRCWKAYAEHYPLFELASICGYSALGHRPECASLRCSVHQGTKDSARTANWDCLRECQGRQIQRASSQRWSLSGNCVCLVAVPSVEARPSSWRTRWVQYALLKPQPYLGSRVCRPLVNHYHRTWPPPFCLDTDSSCLNLVFIYNKFGVTVCRKTHFLSVKDYSN